MDHIVTKLSLQSKYKLSFILVEQVLRHQKIYFLLQDHSTYNVLFNKIETVITIKIEQVLRHQKIYFLLHQFLVCLHPINYDPYSRIRYVWS